jgi:hypothetical protein
MSCILRLHPRWPRSRAHAWPVGRPRCSSTFRPSNIAALLRPSAQHPPLPDGGTLTVNGYVRTVRKQKRIAFAAIGDGSTLRTVQAVLPPQLAEGSVTFSATRPGADKVHRQTLHRRCSDSHREMDALARPRTVPRAPGDRRAHLGRKRCPSESVTVTCSARLHPLIVLPRPRPIQSRKSTRPQSFCALSRICEVDCRSTRFSCG